MNPYLSITFRTFTIWVMSSMINGLLTGIYVALFESGPERILAMIVGCGILSLIFSIPGFFIFWIAMLIAINSGIYGRALFRAALSAGLILALATAVISYRLYSDISPTAWFVFPLFIVLSATAGIMVHFRLFKKITVIISG